MASPIIAVCWDVDKTLTTEYSETPLFDYYDVDQNAFWKENEGRIESLKSKGFSINGHVYYLNLILEYVRKGIFKGLNNVKLRELGKDIELFPGMPEFLGELKQIPNVENYLISSGLKRMIEGSELNKYADGVYACEFVDDIELKEIGCWYDGPTKVNALKEIHEGANKFPIGINDVDARNERVKYENMIYIGDGSTDVPCWDFLMEKGGHCYGVYGEKIEGDPRPVNMEQIIHLHESGRIHCYGKADYKKGSFMHDTILNKVREMAERV